MTAAPPATLELPLEVVLRASPDVAAFLESLGLTGLPSGLRTDLWLAGLSETVLLDLGLDREQLTTHLRLLLQSAAVPPPAEREAIRTLTLRGGHGKGGERDREELTVRAGEIVCVVGPTGSGKSRLLADIECLAQGDTPSGRHILLNGAEPTVEQRFAPDRKLVAQISQNMNFVVDLTVGAFLAMHAACRQVDPESDVAERIIAVANTLAGERFGADVSLTQLSGGQSRALMIADAALLTASPIVLIDEIENAGIDRRQALDLLVATDKIVLVSTHDPLLALLGHRRVIIRHGRVADVIATNAGEKAVLRQLENIDATLAGLRHKLRQGARIDVPIVWRDEPAATCETECPMPEPGEIPDRLQFLLQRQSCATLGEPAPGADALRLIVQAALRGPDHLRLRPYTFIVAAGEGLNRLGAIMQRAAVAAGKPDDVVRRAPNMPRRAPMVIIVVASPKPHDLVPVFDQQLAAGCTVMTMQMAAQALGFGGIWRSGWFMYDRGLHRDLGLADDEQIVGFLYLGTPQRGLPPVPVVENTDEYIRWL